MLLPKHTGIRTASLRAALRLGPTRCLSTSAARPWATPTNRYAPNDPRGGNPVDDIDLVFDYPTEGQVSYQKQTLEASGVHPKQAVGSGTLGKAVRFADHNAIYIGLGALGLGGLYMLTRRKNGGSKSESGNQGDMSAQRPIGSKMERMIGRGR
ncbi:hypothetical protein VTK56DRAFT_5549 [Thermocarpiscus australiensis]